MGFECLVGFFGEKFWCKVGYCECCFGEVEVFVGILEIGEFVVGVNCFCGV